MAQLTDEEKAQAILNGEEVAPEQPEQPSEEQQIEQEPLEEQPEKPEAQPAEPAQPTFTKQFSNLRGDSWDEYGPELEKAYQNSFTEALRLKRELDDARRLLATSQPPQAPAQPAQTPTQQTAAAITPPSDPALQYAQTLMQRDMRTAFDQFANQYPQVREEANFTKFRDAATPIGQAFVAVEGREPTYDELFPRIAAVLGWQPADVEARKDQGLKETLAQGHTPSGQTSSAPRRSRVTDAQLDTYLKFYPTKSRADALRELEEAIS